MKRLFQEWRTAGRVLRRHPTFALATITTLALGIGANTAVFSIVHGVLLRPLPYADPDQLALLSGTNQASVPDVKDWRAQSRTLSSVAALMRRWDVDLVGSGEPQRLAGSVVEPDFFKMLGVTAIQGRIFDGDDDRLGAAPVALISDRLWSRQFGRDPSAVGRTVVLNDRTRTIVGVMPASADVFGDNIDVWLPVATETPWALTQRGTNNFDVIARLRGGVSWSAARRELGDISAELARTYPQTNTGKVAVPEPLLDALVGDVRTPILMLEGAVLIVLVLVSANLMGLLIARADARGPEVALRTALGARRAELAMMLSAEGSLIALIGGVSGLGLAVLTRRLLLAALPASLPRVGDIRVDWPVIAYTVALLALIGIVIVAAPVLYAVRTRPVVGSRTTRRTDDSRSAQRVLGGLVAAEAGMAVVVLSLAALLGRTYSALDHVQPGFDSDHVLSGELVLPEARYTQVAAQTRVFRAVVQRLAASPGIEAAGSVIGLPLGPGGGIGHGVAVEGQPPATPGSEPGVRVRPVTGDYFQVLRIPIRAGRSFTGADDERAVPVAIVNETLARQLWPTESPINHRIRWVGADSAPQWITIIGIAGDTRTNGLTNGDQPAVYMPYVQHTETWIRWGTLVVRGRGDPAELASTMRAAVAAADPLIPLGNVSPMAEYRSAAMAQQRLDAVVLAVFALGALLIAIQGVYSTLAYVVEQRRREIGIRLAVGATPGAVQRTVVGRGMRAVAIGTVAGLVAAAAAGQAARGLLYGVSADDPATYVVVACVVLAAALCGALRPAARASRADPVAVLRSS